MERMVEEGDVLRELEKEGIRVLSGFTEQQALVRSYYRKFYGEAGSRIVFCGINPGRFGAGKTGIPFIDFHALDHLMPGFEIQHKEKKEKSAQFILSIIERYGAKDFYNAVYMTNVSWYGFQRDRKNLNYYDLPHHLRHLFTTSFLHEMEIVQPTVIVPLSKEVEQTLRQMATDGLLDYPIAERLSHPYHCSFTSNIVESSELYCKAIEQHTVLQRKEDSLVFEVEPLVPVTVEKSDPVTVRLDTMGFKQYLLKRHEVNPAYKPLSESSVKQYHNRLENMFKRGIYNGELEITPEIEHKIDLKYKDTSRKYPLTIRYYIEYMESKEITKKSCNSFPWESLDL